MPSLMLFMIAQLGCPLKIVWPCFIFRCLTRCLAGLPTICEARGVSGVASSSSADDRLPGVVGGTTSTVRDAVDIETQQQAKTAAKKKEETQHLVSASLIDYSKWDGVDTNSGEEYSKYTPEDYSKYTPGEFEFYLRRSCSPSCAGWGPARLATSSGSESWPWGQGIGFPCVKLVSGPNPSMMY